MNNKKVLITGGAGFIGAYLTNILFKNDFEVFIIDNFSPQIHGKKKTESYLYNMVKDKAKIYDEDIIDSKSLDYLIDNCNYVVHLAAETGTGQSMYEISNYVKTNSLGTARILEKLVKRKHNVNKFILASSRAVYGEGMYKCKEHGVVYPNRRCVKDLNDGNFECRCPICNSFVNAIPTSEDCYVSPKSIYGITKYNQEQLVNITCESINLPYTIFRFQNVYGKGQSMNNPYTGILAIFSKLILEGKEINVFEDGNESRDFIHVEDVVSAVFKDIKSNTSNNIINVGTGISTSVIQVVETLKQSFSLDVNYRVSGSYRIGDIRHNIADTKLINDRLHFVPKINFEDGISELVVWINEIGIFKSTKSFENSIDEMERMKFLVKK